MVSSDNLSKIRTFLMGYAAIIFLFAAIGPFTSSSSWRSSSDFHACIEISSSIVAIIAAIACLMYFFGLGNRYYLIIGLGFFICGSEDLIHGILDFKLLSTYAWIDLSRFIPGTYTAGKSMLALMIIAAPYLETTLESAIQIKREAIVFSIIALILGGGATVLAVSLHLPKFIYPELLIPRPVDLVSALLFTLAFFLILRRYLSHRDTFSGALLASILLNVCGQIYMSFSRHLYDAFFDIAHFSNFLSYCMPVLGISILGLEMINDSKKTTKSLLENEQKLRTLFGTMTEIMVLHELVHNDRGEVENYRIIDCNHAFTTLTGIQREKTIGKLATEIYQGKKPPYLEEFSHVALTGIPHEFTAYFPPLDKHFLISTISPHRGQFATISTDITAFKQISEIVTAKNRELENYLYVASHDMRSPLINIQGFSHRLKKLVNSIKDNIEDSSLESEKKLNIKKITDESIPRTLEFIFNNVSKMDSLINGLLQISRTGRIEMVIQKINMEIMIKKIAQNFKSMLENSESKIIIKELPACYGDENLLTRVFYNLIDNALKFRDKNRQLVIEIEAKKKYNKTIYRVKDTGIGIAQKHIGRVWDVFYRVDSQSHETGEGIGLSIVKQIIDRHRGKIKIESDEGKGSTL